MLQILLVSGGTVAPTSNLDSTELFDANIGSWTIAGATLPNQMRFLSAATIDNRVLIFGIFYIE